MAQNLSDTWVVYTIPKVSRNRKLEIQFLFGLISPQGREGAANDDSNNIGPNVLSSNMLTSSFAWFFFHSNV